MNLTDRFSPKCLLQGLLVAALALVAMPARAQFYLTDNTAGAIASANTTVGSVATEFWTSVGDANYLAVDQTYVYYGVYTGDPNNSYINRALLASPYTVDTWTIQGLSDPTGIAVVNGYIYWGDYLDGKIYVLPIASPGNAPTIFVSGLSAPEGVRTDGTYLYWADSGTGLIGRSILGTTTSTTAKLNWIITNTSPVDVALTSQYVYWVDGGTSYVGRASNEATPSVDNFSWGTLGALSDVPNGLVVSDQIYWAGNVGVGTLDFPGTTSNPHYLDTTGLSGGPYYAIVLADTVTVVSLTSFTATPKANQVVVAWTTGSEVDTAGFNVQRSASAAGPFTQVNANLIPATGTGLGGASYAWTDTGVTAGQTYYYQLADVDTHGVVTLHGPVSVTVGASPILSFTATPIDVFLGGGTFLAWTVNGTPALTLNGGAATGSGLWLTPASTTAYTLSDGQGDQNLVTVTVKPFGLLDMAGLSLAWGSAKGDANYNPCYDLNGDGKVDDADVALCFNHL